MSITQDEYRLWAQTQSVSGFVPKDDIHPNVLMGLTHRDRAWHNKPYADLLL